MKTFFTTTILFLATFLFGKDESFVKEKFVHARNSTLSFTRNDGQIDTHGKADCRFTTTVGGANYFFCTDGIISDFRLPILDFGLKEKSTDILNPKSKIQNLKSIKGHVLKLNFLARTNFLAEVHGQDEQEYKCNYFIGNDASKWHTSVPNYSRIVYNNVWSGIDVVYYGDVTTNHLRRHGERSRTMMRDANASSFDYAQDDDAKESTNLKYDVIVHPGANPNQIQFAYEGQDALSIDSKGNLVLKTSVGDVIEQTPYVYQIIDGVKKEVPSNFVLTNPASKSDQSPFTVHCSFFTFALGDYDKTKELIIDPAYSTFLGGGSSDGSGSVGGGFPMDPCIAVDAYGNAYVAGTTNSSNFPKTTGAYDTTYQAGCFVTKLNAAGSALVFSTFLGGTSGSCGSGIAVDASGNAFITGRAGSGFPTQGAFQTTFGGGTTDAFVTKLNAMGDLLIYSTYLGGLALDEAYGIAIDSSGSAYVTGYTGASGNNQINNFPTTAGAYNTNAPANIQHAFMTKLNAAGTALVFSTFLGGVVTSYNANFVPVPVTKGYGIAVDRYNNAFVTGNTNCSDFPTSTGAYRTTRQQQLPSTNMDAFVTKFDPAKSGNASLVYSTFLGGGGSLNDAGYGIAVDTGGNAFITGLTSSTTFPTTVGAFQTTSGGAPDAFVTKLKPAGQGTNDLLYSTYLGGTSDDYGSAIAVDGGGNVFVSGATYSTNFPTTAGAFQTSHKGSGYSAFVTKLKLGGQDNNDLLYSTFLDGNSAGKHSSGPGIAVDAVENVFITGLTSSAAFPTTVGAFQPTYGGGGNDVFVTKFGLGINPVIATINSLDMGHVLCDPAQKTFVVSDQSEIPLRIDSIKIVDTTNFTIVSPGNFPVWVSSNLSAQITINFKPGTPGPKTTILKIYSNDRTPLSDSLKTVTLVGVVDVKNRFITINKTKLDFGTIACDSSAPDLQITVYDTSNTFVQIKPIISGSEASFYTITPSDTTIEVGDSVVYTVRFQPIAGGSYNAMLLFTLPQCSQLDTVLLTGYKNSQVSFTARPSAIEYFSCGQKQIDSVIIVKNTGTTSLALDSAIVSGLGFSLVSPKDKVTLAPGDSVKYVIRFTLKQINPPDKYIGTFIVRGPCQSISQHDLVGWKTSLFVTPKSVDFGGLSCNDSYRDTSVTVTIKGSQAIVTATIVGGSFITLTPSTAIKADSSKDFRIRFKPDSAGTFHAKLIFTTSVCPGIKDTVDLVGGKASTACLSSDPKALQFDTLSCEVTGSHGEDTTISLCNCSSSQITLDSAHVTGTNFTLTGPLGKITLPAGQCQDYIIHFSPLGPGTYNGIFSVNGMPCYISSSVSLQGVCKPTVGVRTEKELSYEFSLEQNHPNPFSQLSVVSYQLSGERNGIFEVRDMLGRVVYQTSASSHSTQLTINASGLPNGLYLYSLNDGKNIQSRRMVVMK